MYFMLEIIFEFIVFAHETKTFFHETQIAKTVWRLNLLLHVWIIRVFLK